MDDQKLQAIRPEIKSIDTSVQSGTIETFQNEVLRPIIKMHNDKLLFIAASEKNLVQLLTKAQPEKRLITLRNYVQKNRSLKNQFIGIVLGWFTQKELSFYCSSSKVLNKRIVTMVIERLEDHTLEITSQKNP